MIRRALFVAGLALALTAGCGGEDPAAAGTFIALTENFRPFRTWTRTAVGTMELPEHPAGPRFAYANQPPPAEGMSYPVGTIIVHTIEATDDPLTWDLFAMVKRGGGYNASGARDWEFFRLGVSSGGVPVILGRGLNPSDGHSYGGGGATTQMAGCNTCHGAGAGDAHDHVLSPLLRPGASR